MFDDLIYYELFAFSSTAGALESFGIIENNVAKTVFRIRLMMKKKENVVFEFRLIRIHYI